MFCVSISHVKVGVCTSRKMWQLRWGGGDHWAALWSTRSSFPAAPASVRTGGIIFTLKQFYYGECKFSFHFYDRTWNFMSDRLLRSLGLGPFPHIVVMFLRFRVMLVANFAKQTLACHVPLSWSLYSFLYVLFLRYIVFNKEKRRLNEHNSMVNILK